MGRERGSREGNGERGIEAWERGWGEVREKERGRDEIEERGRDEVGERKRGKG